ncbi:hypothetical protein [Hymenobacter sediminicola]|uniref:hypothetical protein n=1 Tax=Hymenobacter sediminicola TaxID=2761579 RepID=UPI0021AEFCC5|nr:hypothetical protein [Hymenobacter sediminicola]
MTEKVNAGRTLSATRKKYLNRFNIHRNATTTTPVSDRKEMLGQNGAEPKRHLFGHIPPDGVTLDFIVVHDADKPHRPVFQQPSSLL